MTFKDIDDLLEETEGTRPARSVIYPETVYLHEGGQVTVNYPIFYDAGATRCGITSGDYDQVAPALAKLPPEAKVLYRLGVHKHCAFEIDPKTFRRLRFVMARRRIKVSAPAKIREWVGIVHIERALWRMKENGCEERATLFLLKHKAMLVNKLKRTKLRQAAPDVS